MGKYVEMICAKGFQGSNNVLKSDDQHPSVIVEKAGMSLNSKNKYIDTHTNTHIYIIYTFVKLFQ